MTPELIRQICAIGMLDAKTVRAYFKNKTAVRESSRLRIESALRELGAKSYQRSAEETKTHYDAALQRLRGVINDARQIAIGVVVHGLCASLMVLQTATPLYALHAVEIEELRDARRYIKLCASRARRGLPIIPVAEARMLWGDAPEVWRSAC
jgi:hypothetical protein